MRKNQHVLPDAGKWVVKGEGNVRRTGPQFDTQADAIARAREIAIKQRSEVVIHRPDGTIRDKDSYGRDPNPPKDTKR